MVCVVCVWEDVHAHGEVGVGPQASSFFALCFLALRQGFLVNWKLEA